MSFEPLHVPYSKLLEACKLQYKAVQSCLSLAIFLNRIKSGCYSASCLKRERCSELYSLTSFSAECEILASLYSSSMQPSWLSVMVAFLSQHILTVPEPGGMAVLFSFVFDASISLGVDCT